MAFAPEERGRDATGDGLTSEHIAERGPLGRRVLAVDPRHRISDPGPRPVRGGVVSPLRSIRAPDTLAVPTHIDDLGVPRPDPFDVDAETLARVGQQVGEKHIGGFHQAVEQLEAFWMANVDRHAPLAAVGLLHQVVHVARPGDETGADETALRVASLGVLDLQDIGTPIGQHAAGRRHERPGCELDHAYAFENRIHVRLPQFSELSNRAPTGRPARGRLVKGWSGMW